MDMMEYFRRMFTYDDWANREVLTGFAAAGAPPQRCLELMAHILSAERLWLERLLGQPQTLPVWPQFTAKECETQAAELPGLWRQYLDSLGDLETMVAYRNTQGESWSSRVADVLTHVIMHSVYHRGQIATSMRIAGFQPANTDFIHSTRRGFVK
jgi:uncharacterized damage-inducible protein DinB